MKRSISIMLCGACMCLLGGCTMGVRGSDASTGTDTFAKVEVVSINDDTSEESDSVKEDTEEVATSEEMGTEERTVQNEDSQAFSEEVARQLMDKNIECNDIFILGALMPENGWEPEDGNLVPVADSRFPDWETFESFVYSVYCKECADMYLYNFPYEGDAKYVNVAGKVYVNMNYVGGKGYYVDWSDYSIEIKEETDSRCVFDVTGSIEEPSDNPTKEPYTVTATAVLENGKWVLENLIY